jgi:A/G-specific adenine glycosylase
LPVKTNKTKNRSLYLAVAIVKQGETFLFTKSDKGLLSGLWGFPSAEGTNEASAKEKLIEALNNAYGLEVKDATELGKEKHVFTHKTWQMTVYGVRANSISSYQENESVNEEDELYEFKTSWISSDEIENLAISTAFRKIMKYL